MTTDEAKPVYSSKLSIFDDDSRTDLSIASREYVICRPSIPITAERQSPIEIIIPPHETAYNDMKASRLCARVKVIKSDGATLTSSDHVSPVQNFLHSVFQDITVKINQKLAYSSDNLLPYKCYMEKLCTSDYEDKNVLFFEETTNGEPGGADVTAREALIAESKFVEMSGAIPVDLFQCNKLFPNKMEISLTLNRSPDAFALLAAAADKDYKYILEDVYIKLVRCHLSPNVYNMLESRFEKNELAKFPYKSISVRSVPIQSGSLSVSHDRIWVGDLPYAVLAGVVSVEAFKGKQQKNPFNFQSASITKINVSTNTEQEVFGMQLYDFANEQVLDGYLRLCELINNTSEKFINRNTFKNGKTIFGFDLSPRLLGKSLSVHRTGSLRLDINFSTAPTENCVCVLYGLFASNLYIDKFREISFEK